MTISWLSGNANLSPLYFSYTVNFQALKVTIIFNFTDKCFQKRCYHMLGNYMLTKTTTITLLNKYLWQMKWTFYN